MVKVKALLVKQQGEVRHREGLTVAQALEGAKVSVPQGGAVTVYRMDGRNVAGERSVAAGDLATALVADNEVVVVTPPVANG
ncbi:MAG: hypothetical protein WAP23_00235 [Candidatus Spechtbacterales bacterium]